MNSAVLSILAAVLLSLPFSRQNLWQFAWIGFVPLFIALENKSLRRSFFIAYLSGFVFWSVTIYWLIHVTLLGQVILIAYLALYFGIAGLIITFLKKSYGILFFPCFWVLLEYIRSYLFTGFPWALTGFSQYKNLAVIQISDITGAWGVSFLVLLVNVLAYSVLRKKIKIKTALILSSVILVSLVYGSLRLSYKPEQKGPSVKISVVAGNIPQELKWDKRAVNFIQNSYEELTATAAKEEPDLIIWPEASVPALLGADAAEYQRLYSFVKDKRINLLTGAVSYLDGSYYNSALFIDQQGRPADIYNKLHLVPFGEFIPLKNIFPFLQSIAPIGDIKPGKDFKIFAHPAPFGVLICFEDLFPELSREFVKKGAKFLVNITNDAWYKETSAAAQHFAASVFRAVENRRYLARSANTGVSGFIDPYGRILSLIRNNKGKEIFIKGYSSRDVYLDVQRRSFYNQYGDVFVLFCLLLDAYAIIFILKNKK